MHIHPWIEAIHSCPVTVYSQNNEYPFKDPESNTYALLPASKGSFPASSLHADGHFEEATTLR